MKKKLQEALAERKELEKKKGELYYKIGDVSPVKRKSITDEEKKKEIENVMDHIKKLRKIVEESITFNKKIQKIGFESGIKDMLIELEELKSYYALLKSLIDETKMGSIEWISLERVGYDTPPEEVVSFLPIDVKWLEKERERIKKRILKLDTNIQELNWKVEVDL